MNYRKLSKEILIAFHLNPDEFDDVQGLKDKLRDFVEAQKAVMDIFSVVAIQEGYAYSKLLRRLLGQLYYLYVITLGLTDINQAKLIRHFTKDLLEFYKPILTKESISKVKRMSKFLIKMSKQFKGVNLDEFDKSTEGIQD